MMILLVWIYYYKIYHQKKNPFRYLKSEDFIFTMPTWMNKYVLLHEEVWLDKARVYGMLCILAQDDV